MTSDTKLVEVTQADRDAAAAWRYDENCGPIGQTLGERMRSGENDDHSLIQAFARHRIASQEAAAKIADRMAACANASGGNDAAEALGEDIAAEIRTASSLPSEIRRECDVCKAVVATFPQAMCCHCQEMPWRVSTQDDGDGRG